jgi:hypothetical protein
MPFKFFFPIVLILVGPFYLSASNEDHQPFGPDEWPETLDLKELHASEEAADSELKLSAEEKTEEGDAGLVPGEIFERLYPIQNKRYEKIALRSMQQGDGISFFLSFIDRESSDGASSESYQFAPFTPLGALESYEGDLNGDTYPDYVFVKYFNGNGLAWGYANVGLVLSEGDNDFSVEVVESYAPEPKDFISINGQTAFIHASFQYGDLCTDGKYHNFWVYRLYSIDDNQIAPADHLSPDFPKVVFYSFKPNQKETNLLTQEAKDALIAESAMVIH